MECRPDWPLLARFVAGQCSPDEERRVEAWVREDPSRKQLLRQLRSIWTAAGETSAPPIDVAADWRTLRARMGVSRNGTASGGEAGPPSSRRGRPPARRSRPASSKAWRAGAIGGMLLLLGTWLAWLAGPLGGMVEQGYQTILTGHGERSRIELVDGSSVMLNVDSRLRIPASFHQRNRTVELTGEAYFQVQTDSARPFVVRTTGASVTVRGTAFNVRGYPDEGRVQVAVAEGGVAFRARGGKADRASSVPVDAGEVGWLAPSDVTIRTQRADVAAHIGWTEGRLVFEDTPLPQVARRLERWYGLTVRISDPSLHALRLTATLKSRSERQVLDVIAATLGIQYRLREGVVTLSPRGQPS